MKVIFLDIDGVLNGYNRWNVLGWKVVSKLNSLRLRIWYKKFTDPCGIHESKVKRLANIINVTGAKVVMSSSWRHSWWRTPYEEMTDRQKQLTDLLNKYNIEIIDITPSLQNARREDEIIAWLSRHENDITNFVILDDENSFLSVFWEDARFIQTSTVPKGTLIKGLAIEDTGLKNKHVRKAIKVLNNKEELV